MLGRFELRSILGADVDDRLRALVARALAPDPSQRHPEQQPGQLVAQARPVADLMQSPEQGGWHFVASDKGGAVHGSGVPGGTREAGGWRGMPWTRFVQPLLL